VTDTIRVRVLLEEHAVGAPSYQSDHASGVDLFAAVPGEVVLPPGEVVAVPTGLRLEIPPGFEGQIRARSGLAARHAIGVPNAPGTIDADYRGEVKVLLVNFGRNPYTVRRGDRIAQLVFAPVARAELDVATALGQTVRGEGGFGHTGR
jgi:dUTP pyrophosphatase